MPDRKKIIKQPTVSVVITTMNRSESVLRAIHSVFAQTYCEYDLHVVDDGSSDSTPEVVRQILAGHENAFFWQHKSCNGLSTARNTGIAKSKGKFIAFLDDDDELKPESLHKRISAIKDLSNTELEKIGVVYSGCEVHIPHEKRITYNMPRIQGNIAEFIQANELSTIPSAGMYPRKVLEMIGGFDEALISSVDHDLWMSLAKHGFSALPVYEPLTITYSHRGQQSMVSDIRPRIQGVEQFLEKWRPVYEKWYGMRGAKKYIQAYRTRVLGALAAKKSADREWRDAWRLLKHVLWYNRLAPGENLRLAFLFLRFNLRNYTPVRMIAFVRDRRTK